MVISARRELRIRSIANKHTTEVNWEFTQDLEAVCSNFFPDWSKVAY
jgi:hypothetical protein